LLRLAQAAAERGVRIVLMTDQWLSPIARVATHVLSARVAVPSVWDSSTALMALSEALLADVSRQGWDISKQRMSELENMRERLNGNK
jgi:DNA-binding MurR/RpiR family transcriptional regulator